MRRYVSKPICISWNKSIILKESEKPENGTKEQNKPYYPCYFCGKKWHIPSRQITSHGLNTVVVLEHKARAL
jgi:hypothetical protein